MKFTTEQLRDIADKEIVDDLEDGRVAFFVASQILEQTRWGYREQVIFRVENRDSLDETWYGFDYEVGSGDADIEFADYLIGPYEVEPYLEMVTKWRKKMKVYAVTYFDGDADITSKIFREESLAKKYVEIQNKKYPESKHSGGPIWGVIELEVE